MRESRILGISALLWLVGAVVAPTAQSAGRVVKMDPALDAIVPESATVEKVARGLGFAEGPVWRDGGLLFSDIPGNAIHRLQGGQASVFRMPIFEGEDFKPGFHIGSNDLTIDRQRRLIWPLSPHGASRTG